MLESVLTSVSAADDAVASDLFDALVAQRGEEVVPQLGGLVDEIAPIAKAFLKRAGSNGLSASRRVEAARLALKGLLKHGLLDEADEALAHVLEAAMRGVGRPEAMRLLRENDDLSRIREPEDIQLARAQLHLAAGEKDLAAGILTQLASQALARSAPWERAEAAAAIEFLEELPGHEEIVAEFKCRLARVQGKLEAPRATRTSRSIRLLVVGGAEVQAQYEAQIKEILKCDANHIGVEFIPTGWGSNWGSVSEEVIRKLQNADGMVLHYFIRTMFGRKVRKAAKVWCSVGGHGRDGILRGIFRCAAMVSRRDSTGTADVNAA